LRGGRVIDPESGLDAAGIRHVLVAGAFVVQDGGIVAGSPRQHSNAAKL
jgi:hypothetical protein